MLAAMRWAQMHAPEITHMATVAVDTPFFPRDLIEHLRQALAAGARVSYASTSAGPEPVFALADLALGNALARDIAASKANKVVSWFATQAAAEVLFPDVNAFFNINLPADLDHAAALRRD
jgi:molybdopterin-guanine dinucleotide biosynthesis protein A